MNNKSLRRHLENWIKYIPETGAFVWLKRPNSKIGAWETAGYIRADGYRQITIKGKRFYAHRLAWFFMNGEMPSGPLDHINGDTDDNRWDNLRLATAQINALNQKTPRTNTSGHIGVNRIRKTGKWQASIKVYGNSLFLGNYENIHDAISARLAAEKEYGFHENHGR